MDINTELQIWEASSVEVVNVHHRLLLARSLTERFECNSFIFVLGKSGTMQTEDVPYRIAGNALVQLPADKTLILDSGEGELEFFCLEYRAEPLPDTGQSLLTAMLRDNPFRKCRVVHTADPGFFAERFTWLADNFRDKEPLTGIGQKAVFYAILQRLFSEIIAEGGMTQKPDSTQYALKYMQKHFSEPVSIGKLAAYLQISRQTLTENFKQKQGIGPSEYLMRLRLDAAAFELAESSLSIEEIAASCGLRDKSYLSRVFKKKYGVSPGAFRKASAGTVKYSGRFYNGIRPGREEPGFVRIENMGRVHRYYGIPGRIVCLDYAAAELCAALGIADRMTGVASSEESLLDCRKEYRSQLGKVPFLPGKSADLNVPTFEEVCSCRPDMVIGTGYSFRKYNGVADPEDFESRGIHIYAMTATFTPGCGFDSVYADIRNIGEIFARKAKAEELIRRMRQEEEMLSKLREQGQDPVRVFVFDASVEDQAFTCGRTLENHMITAAGGENIFGDRAGLFFPVSWEEVGELNPQIIIVHSFHAAEDGRQKISLLKQIPEIAQTEAVQNGRFLITGIKKIFPSIDCTETALRFARRFHLEPE